MSMIIIYRNFNNNEHEELHFLLCCFILILTDMSCVTRRWFPPGRWTRQRVGEEVSGRGAANRGPDAVLHSVQVVPAEEPTAERKPGLQPW